MATSQSQSGFIQVNLSAGNALSLDSAGALILEAEQSQVSEQSSGHNAGVEVGARVQVSFGTAWNASANVSQSKASGDHAGVGQQSGLFAGDGGYHVNVGGAVNLVGGAIASTNAGNSELSAAELNFRDLRNTMDYSASTASLGAGFGGAAGEYQGTGTGMGAADRANVGGGVPMHESGSDSSTTYAPLTEGDITIGGKATTAAELGINTDASKAHQQLDDLPDLQKVLADQQAMAAAAGTVVASSRQVADDLAAHAQDKMVAAANAYLDGLSPEQQAAFGTLSGPEQQDYLLSHSADYRDAYGSSLQWGIGGDYNRALQAVTTALVGSVAGQGGTQAVANALAPYAAQLIGNRFDENHGSDPNAATQLLAHALLGAVLAEVNGGNAAGGALAGAGGELAAGMLMNALPGADKQTISALSQAIGALSGSLIGSSMNEAVTGGDIAKNAVENNRQLHWDQYFEKLVGCQGNPNGSGCDATMKMGDGTQSSVISRAQEGGVAYGVVVNTDRETGDVVSYVLTDMEGRPRIIMEKYECNAFINSGIGSWSLGMAPSYGLDLGSAGVHVLEGNYSEAISDLGNIFTNGEYWRGMVISLAFSAAAIKPVKEIKLVGGAYEGGSYK
ncbi:VENN motif pre-toxin domain-containing protein [Stenotrophomonas mori]|uniref:VENN motif pre-toxin domain-containing protein n=1 Tax=Stenotrophomonas mori TaxID=2871096 RepID=UPI00201FD0D5